MYLITLALSVTLFSTFLSSTLGGVVAERNPFKANNYTIDVMQFNGTIAGIPFVANGSIQHVYDQFFALHPEINATRVITELATRDVVSTSALNRRNKDGLICTPVPGWPWQPASESPIVDGITELKNSGICGVNARSCVTLSCKYSGAIWLCNDNDYWIGPSCAYLASYAQDIHDRCGYCFGAYPNCDFHQGGQEFDSDRYNVIVRLDNC